MTVMKFTKDMIIRNLNQLPRGTGAKYLEVMTSHISGEFIAVQWRNSLKVSNDHILIEL